MTLQHAICTSTAHQAVYTWHHALYNWLQLEKPTNNEEAWLVIVITGSKKMFCHLLQSTS